MELLGIDVIYFCVALTVALTVLGLILYTFRGPRITLPGPVGLPILGHVPFFGGNPHIIFSRWRKQYGDIYKIRVGCRPTVVVNGRELIREALTRRSDDFSGRPKFCSWGTFAGSKNIAFGKFDARWIRHRELVRNVLLTFIDDRNTTVEGIINVHLNHLLQKFKSKGDYPFNPLEDLKSISFGIIYDVCYGTADGVDYDSSLKKVMKAKVDFNAFLKTGSPACTMPWQKIHPSSVQRCKEIDIARTRNILEYEEVAIDGVSDVTGGLLAAWRHLQDKDKQLLGLTKDQLMSTVDIVFSAGLDSIANTLHWTLLLLAAFPDVQDKVRKEIYNVIGSSRRPCLADKQCMLYTEATTAEVMRFSCVFPLALPHCTTVDTSLGGHSIPRSTPVYFNFRSLTHDEDVWGDPGNFRPERFVNKDGDLDKELLDRFVPFSSGRRRCVAEPLARMEFFLLLTGLVQACRIEAPRGVAVDLEPVFETSFRPKPYEIKIKLIELPQRF